MDLRHSVGDPAWIPLRAAPGSRWFIDYLLPGQLQHLVAAGRCRRLPDGSAVPAGARARRQSRGQLRHYLLTRDGRVCALCGRPVRRQPTVEHLVPRALARLWNERDPLPPDHRLWTMAPAHRSCNQARGCGPLLPLRRGSPQLALSHWALGGLLPGGVRTSAEVAAFAQLAGLLPPGERRAAWAHLRRLFAARPGLQAHVYRGRLLAYRNGRALALPAALRQPANLAWLRAQLRAGAQPVLQSVQATRGLAPEQWEQAACGVRFL